MEKRSIIVLNRYLNDDCGDLIIPVAVARSSPGLPCEIADLCVKTGRRPHFSPVFLPLFISTAVPTIDDAVCLQCSCMCDDIRVTVVDNQVVEVANACPLGEQWFRQQRPASRPACRIEGREATIEQGIGRAAEILTSALYPLIYGFGETTCEAQQAAVEIADWVGGTIDTATSFGHAPSIQAFQNVGKTTCSLGEIRNRSDLVVYWGADPVANQPRLLTKHTVDPTGLFVPRGPSGRYLVVVDIRDTETSARADLFLKIKPQSDFECLWTLRSLARDIEPNAERIEQQTGIPLATWQALMQRMKRAQYGALLFGMGLMQTRGYRNNCEALLQLGRDMNRHARFVCRSVRQRGNVTGADKVVAWQTGYPFCVNLSRGYPRYNPGEFNTSTQLALGEADAAMIVGNDPMPGFTRESREHLRRIPYISLSADETDITREATVSFATAKFGLETGGTVYRMDEVPLPLRLVRTSPYPSDAVMLGKLKRRVEDTLRAR
jgi:formylmethanofuran dehydrogenase subunit B